MTSLPISIEQTKLSRSKSCPNNGDLPKSPFLLVGGTVPIGRRDFEHRRGLLPRARRTRPVPRELWLIHAPAARAPWPSALINRSIEEERRVQVLVRDNNVDQALRVLKKKMQREGVFREMKLRGHYEKPSEKRVREKAEAATRRARKLARKKLQREGLLPMKPRPVPCAGPGGAPGRGGPPRAPRPPRF